MIRQQNVSSRVKPRFDQFRPPSSLSLTVEEMVVCVWSRGRRREQESIWVHSYTRDDLFMSGH